MVACLLQCSTSHWYNWNFVFVLHMDRKRVMLMYMSCSRMVMSMKQLTSDIRVTPPTISKRYSVSWSETFESSSSSSASMIVKIERIFQEKRFLHTSQIWLYIIFEYRWQTDRPYIGLRGWHGPFKLLKRRPRRRLLIGSSLVFQENWDRSKDARM